MRFNPYDGDELERRLDRDFEVEPRRTAYRPQNSTVAREEANERLALKFALVEQDTSNAALEDEDGIDGPFDAAMDAAISEDRGWRPSDAQQPGDLTDCPTCGRAVQIRRGGRGGPYLQGHADDHGSECPSSRALVSQQTASQVAAVDAAREANKLAETIATLLADTKSRRIRECVSELKDRAWELLTELEHGGQS